MGSRVSPNLPLARSRSKVLFFLPKQYFFGNNNPRGSGALGLTHAMGPEGPFGAPGGPRGSQAPSPPGHPDMPGAPWTWRG